MTTTRPFLSLKDLPSDPNGTLGSLRREASNAYNAGRHYPGRMQLLRVTLLHVLAEIDGVYYGDYEDYAEILEVANALDESNTALYKALAKMKAKLRGYLLNGDKEKTRSSTTRKRTVSKSSPGSKQTKSKDI